MRELEGIKVVAQGKYLGLPLVIGRSKNQVMSFISESFKKKIQGWKGKLLSQAGKEVLLKSVVMAMLAYAMSVFKPPKGLCKELNSIMANYWWGSKRNKRKIHWMSWNKLTETKAKGGLRFRDLKDFNMALLAKQVWKFITKPNLLVSKSMKAKYFPNTSVLQATKAAEDSWIWQSIHSSIALIEEGSRKNVGYGGTINIWEDRWVTNLLGGKIQLAKPTNCDIIRVKQLIKGQQCDPGINNELFSEEESVAIQSIPLSLYGGRDRMGWNSTGSGIYIIKTGYSLLKEMAKTHKSRKSEYGGQSTELSKG
nr:uncharacterized protein LOC113709907 [Coffea arabica]